MSGLNYYHINLYKKRIPPEVTQEELNLVAAECESMVALYKTEKSSDKVPEHVMRDPESRQLLSVAFKAIELLRQGNAQEGIKTSILAERFMRGYNPHLFDD